MLGSLIPAAELAPGRYSRERLSRHWIDVGRAYYYRADRNRALSSILEAERIAPHKITGGSQWLAMRAIGTSVRRVRG